MHLQNPIRVRVRRQFSLDGLGGWNAAAVPPDAVFWNIYPVTVPPSGFKEQTFTTQYGTGLQQASGVQMVPKTITLQNTDRGGGTRSVANPHYAAPGAIRTDWILDQGKIGAMKVTLPPLSADTKEAWQVQRSAIPLFYTYVVGAEPGQYDRGGVTGAKAGKVYVTNAQAYLNREASNQYGFMKGYIGRKDWMDYLSDGIGYLVQAIVIAGVAYGAYLVAAQAAGTAVSSSSTATTTGTAATEAGSSVAPAYGGVGTSGAGAGSDAILTGGSASSFGTSAAGALKTGVGYVKTAKEIMGVASAIKAATSSKPATTTPAPSLDSSYYGGGSGSGGGAGGSGSAPSLLTQLTTGSTPLYIGGGVLVLLAALMLGKSSAGNGSRRRGR